MALIRNLPCVFWYGTCAVHAPRRAGESAVPVYSILTGCSAGNCVYAAANCFLPVIV